MSETPSGVYYNNVRFKIKIKIMKTTQLQLTEKELNLLTDALYVRWGFGTLEEKPESLASQLLEKLYDSKDELKK
jgi:hypothetical protein